ncbi:MAG: phenylpyruvate tautomerase MIF-related protein [Clostridium sp.]|uniref:phenylpyruvate tautomerase MIF-related protein n=1 Tax=Clostridium sp. TaxID=1506 RepID=UPI002FCC5FAE
MPYIDSSFSGKLTTKHSEILKTKLGKAIEILPGKSEQWLFLKFKDGERLYFQGEELNNGALVEIKMIGSKSRDEKEALTKEICNIYNECLGIDPKHIYIIFSEVSTDNFGWNGELFNL